MRSPSVVMGLKISFPSSRVTVGDSPLSNYALSFSPSSNAPTLMNPSSHQPSPSPSPCTGCGAIQNLSLSILNLRYRANNSRYCTNCILNNHHGLFCPICFQVYDHSPPPNLRLMCLRCPSIAHRSCALPSAADSAAPIFLCPTCADPNFSYFNPSLAERISGSVDEKSRKVLVAASQIAVASMSKAAAVARSEAERRAKEAAVARKKAREALEQLASIVAREEEDKENLPEQFDLNAGF